METTTPEKEIDYSISEWKGSPRTAGNIANQIFTRWGEDAVKEYSPGVNCFTLRGWNERGYRVKKGEKALHSWTFRECVGKNKDKDGNEKMTIYSVPKDVCLFFINQVQEVTKC